MKSESSRRDVGDAAALRIALVVSEYHNAVTDGLRDGAMAVLREAGAPDDEVTVLHVPGAFEVPLVARLAAETHRFDAIICLGCIVRGETPHFEYLASVVAHGIAGASQDTGVPITFGVLTTKHVRGSRRPRWRWASEQGARGCQVSRPACSRRPGAYGRLADGRSTGNRCQADDTRTKWRRASSRA